MRVVDIKPDFSVVVPCYNEEAAIAQMIRDLQGALARYASEIIIVDDGSTDRTSALLKELITGDRIKVISHDRNRGYGAAIKTGITRASGDLIVITDADGTYPNERIPELVEACQNRDMVVGSRTAEGASHSRLRMVPKRFLRAYASWIAGQNIPDVNSGMRVFRKNTVEKFIGILPDTFSFTTTITLAMLTNYKDVTYIEVGYGKRIGKSKIKPIRDTLRFLGLIVRAGTYFAPIKVLGPFIGLLAVLSLVSVGYDVLVERNLTDKTVILILFCFNTAIFALLADMIDKRVGR